MATMTITRVKTKTETESIPVQRFRTINEERILLQRQMQRQQIQMESQAPTPGPYPVKMRCPQCDTTITTRIAQNQNKSILQSIAETICFPSFLLACSKPRPRKVYHSPQLPRLRDLLGLLQRRQRRLLPSWSFPVNQNFFSFTASTSLHTMACY